MIGVNRLRTKILALVLLLCCIFSFALAEEKQTTQIVETLYTAISRDYTLPVYAGDEVRTDVALSLPLGAVGKVTVTAPEDAQYEIWLSYVNTTTSTLPTEMTVTIDGEILCAEMQRVKLNSLWVDDGVFPTDRYGNEIATTPYQAEGILEAGISDSTYRTAEPMLFELKAGTHEISFSVQDGGADISAVTLKAPVQVPQKQSGDAKGDNLIVIEAEQIAARNDSAIRGAGEFNARLSPYDNNYRRVNFLDGASFDEAGEMVTWKFTVAESGWYYLGAYYRQSARADFPTYVDIYVDGAIPHQGAQRVAFDYTTSFKTMQARAGEEPLTLYLEQGEHTLSFCINSAHLTPVYETIDVLLDEINVLSNDVKSLMGGATADAYRTYNMLKNFPDLVERLNGWAARCEESVEYIKQFSNNHSGAAFSSMTLSADQLRRLAEEPENLPRRMSEFSTGSNSAARMLAQQLTDMAVNDLSIDQLYLYQADAKLPAKANWVQNLWAGVERFVTSFTKKDYTAGAANEKNWIDENGQEQPVIQVWMGRSRQMSRPCRT